MSEIKASAGARADNIARGIAFTIIAVLVFGVQDAVAKILVQTYSPFQITMMRFWAFAAFSLFLVARQAPLRQALRSKHPRLQAVRGLLLVFDVWLAAESWIALPKRVSFPQKPANGGMPVSENRKMARAAAARG